jgi:hypothetical protein
MLGYDSGSDSGMESDTILGKNLGKMPRYDSGSELGKVLGSHSGKESGTISIKNLGKRPGKKLVRSYPTRYRLG